MFLTFSQKFHLLYSTNEMVEGRGVITEAVGPQIIKCQAVVSCRQPCCDYGGCLMTSAKGQWCCQGSQSFGNGPKSHHIFILMNDFSIL